MSVLAVLLSVPLVAATALGVTRMDDDRVRQVAGRYAAAWKGGGLEDLDYDPESGPAVSRPADVAGQVAAITRGLGTARPTRVDLLPDLQLTGDRASQGIHVVWTLAPDQQWDYTATLRLRRLGNRWRLVWTPQAVHPGISPGLVLQASRVRPVRAEILGAGRQVLVTERPVVKVSLRPSTMRGLLRFLDVRQVASLAKVDAADLDRRVKAAAAADLVDVVTLRECEWDLVADRMRAIRGVVIERTTLPLAPTRQFARSLLGSAWPATAASVDDGRQIAVGDIAGTSGLQHDGDARLAGTPGLRIMVVPAPDSGNTHPPMVLFERPAVAGRPVLTTLDARVQTAAESALAGARSPAALVALGASDGAIVAVANGGLGADGYDRALLGRYPPGSTFKVVSALALLGDGLGPQTPVDCPQTFSDGGATFGNADGMGHGVRPFLVHFAQSCNTALVSQAGRLTDAALRSAAGRLGYGAPTALGTPAFNGEIPAAADAAGHAAAMIGQGTVLASPLTVAAATATVAAGRYHPPRLVVDPASPPVQAGPALPATQLAGLRAMMRAVVTGGTGTVLARVPGGPVAGKTGTAEVGGGLAPSAWFTGYQGDLAFAVVVERGGYGSVGAAPLARDFLTRLHG
jgi:cell division protein FtsI/penicillin-binding protein 2